MLGLIIIACLCWPIFWLILHGMETSIRTWRKRNDAEIAQARKARTHQKGTRK